ncbi:MAG TPA: branched-chain amino acid ABC transporter permease [Thermodesulfobacteriota bacterium]|nr:branched-chain amino acid ABC transporter permease [Thermodesulfobacteriota bacterium]
MKIGKLFSSTKNKIITVIVIVLLLLPIFVEDPYIMNIIILSLLFAVLACSWNLICGYTGIFTFGHQAFFGLGAYVSSLLAMKAGLSPWLGLLAGGFAAALVGFVIGLPCLRLRAAPYIAITTLAFSEIARIVCMNLVGLTRGELGLWGIPEFPEIPLPGGLAVAFAGGDRTGYYYVILMIFFVTIGLIAWMLRSYVGLAFRAVRDEQDAALSLGIDTTRFKLLAFITSSFFAGVAGAFYAHYILILTPTSVMSVGVMTEIIAVTLVGGLGTFWGPVIGAFSLTALLEYLREFGEYRFMIYGAMLVATIMFMPKGVSSKLFPEKE